MKQEGKRKDRIKNIAIIFLSVMLALTFFSNTIMNYSLPEVATAYVEPGSISAKIRGTGALVADDPYKVSIQESRVIAGVAVKEGDVVEKDQALFYLEDKESEELAAAETALDAAEEALDAAVLTYTMALLSGEISDQSYQNIQSGNISGADSYQARITAARQKVDEAQARVDSLARQLAVTGTETTSSIDAQNALSNAQAALTEASAKLAAAQTAVGTAQGMYDGLGEPEALNLAVNTAQGEALETGIAYAGAEEGFFSQLIKLSQIKPSITDASELSGEYQKILEGKGTKITYQTASESEGVVVQGMAQLSDLIEHIGNSGNGGGAEAASPTKSEITGLLTALNTALADYTAAQAALLAAEQAVTDKNQYSTDLANAGSELSSAQNDYDECNALVQSLTNQVNNNSADRDKQAASLSLQKADADLVLANAQEEYNQLIKDIGSEIDLGNQNNLIAGKQEAVEEAREEVERLREKAVGATVKAPVAGAVTGITKTAGETAAAEETLAVMLPEGKGYSLSFTVTNDQAGKVSVGEAAEVQNSWYDDEVQATLTGIRPDTQEPGRKKLLTFSVKGEVWAGQSLTLTVGKRSADYDLVVPNSALREDNNGKFILIVESRSAPFGNRYLANRVDVEALASDEANTAISAALYGYEYVITTATKPVEAGQQVRLAEN